MLTIVIYLLSLFSLTYIVGVGACCIGNSCLKQTSFRALVDSGTSFTFLPEEVYQKVAKEVHLWLLNFLKLLCY